MRNEILKVIAGYFCCPQDLTPTLMAYYVEEAYWDGLISENQRDEYLVFARIIYNGILGST